MERIDNRMRNPTGRVQTDQCRRHFPANRINYYQLKNGKEIDFVLNKTYALEVKETATPDDLHQVDALAENLGITNRYVTGVPFTDTKRLESVCGIHMQSARTHEISSVFMYDVIAGYGGATAFYRHFYINSPFPLAIIRRAKNGQWLNANYYDDPLLFAMVKDFMIASLKKHISLGLDTSEVFVLGKRNAAFIRKLNNEVKLFDQFTILEHPRFIQQYKSKEKQVYIDKYMASFHGSTD